MATQGKLNWFDPEFEGSEEQAEAQRLEAEGTARWEALTDKQKDTCAATEFIVDTDARRAARLAILGV